MPIGGADALVQSLQSKGATTVFALSGNQIMPVFDALFDTNIRLIHTRHEAAALFMAEAYAQITGSVGIALVTAGGGLGNVIGALMAARSSDTPLLVLSGDSPTTQDGLGAFQEMDQLALTQSLCKGSRRIIQADEMPEAVDWAFDLASSNRPGPVHLALPANVLVDLTSAPIPTAPRIKNSQEQEALKPNRIDHKPLTSALNAASRPLILLGPSLTTTRIPELASNLSNLYQAPALAMQSPRGLKDPGLGRFTEVASQADHVLCLGKAVDFTLGFGSEKLWPNVNRWDLILGDEAQLQISEKNLGNRIGQAIKEDPLIYAMALVQAAESRSNANNTATVSETSQTSAAFSPISQELVAMRSNWIREANSLIQQRVPPESIADSDTESKITPHKLCQAVQFRIDQVDHSTLVCDGGEFGQWAQALLSGQSTIINGVSGIIGGGIAYAIGAKAANPQSTVFALMGDGSAGFHLSEFETAIREDLPFIAIIGNDQRWNAEHLIQQNSFGHDRQIGCELSDARYDLAVEALGGFGVRVTREEELADALSAAVQSRKAACINVELSGLPAPTFQKSV